MTNPLLIDNQDLLRQRRLERGLPADPPPLPSARRLLAFGGVFGAALLTLVIASWALIMVRDRFVADEIGRMSGLPGQLQNLEGQLRDQKGKLDQQTRSNEALANGLVAVSSGSALVAQLSQLTPKGVQITEATVSGPQLALKGRADDPGAFTRVNALSLLLAYEPMFKPDDVRVLKLSREPAETDEKAAPRIPPVSWDLSAGFASLQPAQQLTMLRKLGADGMAKRLQDLERMGMLP